MMNKTSKLKHNRKWLWTQVLWTRTQIWIYSVRFVCQTLFLFSEDFVGFKQKVKFLAMLHKKVKSNVKLSNSSNNLTLCPIIRCFPNHEEIFWKYSIVRFDKRKPYILAQRERERERERDISVPIWIRNTCIYLPAQRSKRVEEDKY